MDLQRQSNDSSSVNFGSAQISAAQVGVIQRRTLILLFATQVIGGVGVGIGISVGALLAADMGGPGISGLASSAAVIGGALLAVPATRLMRTGGRRPGLVFAYLVGAVGALIVVAGAGADQIGLVFLGTLLFGGGTAANLQARYTAVDLAKPADRGRQLSLVVWATTVGAVAGPDARPGGRPRRARPGACASTPGRSCSARSRSAWARCCSRRSCGPTRCRRPAGWNSPSHHPIRPRPPSRRHPMPLSPVRSGADDADPPVGGGLKARLARGGGQPPARLGMSAVAVGHLVMVGVMSMTPVHIDEGGHDHADVLQDRRAWC